MRLFIWTLMLIGMISSFALAVHFRNLADDLQTQLDQAAKHSSPTSEVRLAEARKEPLIQSAPLSSPKPVQTVANAPTSGQEERIRTLEADLEKKDVIIFLLQQAQTNQPAESMRRPPRSQAWMEDMKQNNPEQYAALTNRRAQVRQDVQTAFADRMDYLNNIDPAGMSADEQARHQRMTELINETWRIAEQLQSETPTSDRREYMQTMRQNMRELEPLLTAERSREFHALGLQLGYQGTDANAFEDYINRVIDLTSMGSLFHGRRGPQDGQPRQER